MSNEREQAAQRQAKLEELVDRGVPPYPNGFDRTIDASALVDALQTERNAAMELLLTPNEQAAMEAAKTEYSSQQETTQGALDRYLATRSTISTICSKRASASSAKPRSSTRGRIVRSTK